MGKPTDWHEGIKKLNDIQRESERVLSLVPIEMIALPAEINVHYGEHTAVHICVILL